MRLFQKLGRQSLEVYNDIDDMPAWNWYKIYETQDLSYVCVNTRKTRKKHAKELAIAWKKLYGQYVTRFQMEDGDISKMKRTKIAMLFKINSYLSPDKTRRLVAEAAQDSVEGQKNPKKTVTFMESVSVLERKIGQIDLKTMSVSGYYTHIKLMNIEIQEQKKQIAKWQSKKSSQPR